MSKSTLSLLWVIGPLSGLIVQPIVGVLSDYCTSSKGRRQPYMMGGAFVVGAGILTFAWARELGHHFNVSSTVIATAAVLLVDVSINTCQAACRTLIVDVLPESRQRVANGWASRMSAMGHLASYFLGSLNLEGLGLGNQLQGICLVSAVMLVLCVGITCLSVRERVLVSVNSPHGFFRRIAFLVWDIWHTFADLDPVLASIFKVQLFGWYGWFTFLFYGSTWAAEVWYHDHPGGSTGDMARAGSRALTFFSLSATFFSIVLPMTPFRITPMWGWSYLVYALAAFTVGYIKSYIWALVVFTVIGSSWAMNIWAPFTLTAERIHQLPADTLEIPPELQGSESDVESGGSVESVIHVDSPSIHTGDSEIIEENFTEQSGVYLGLHNAALTFPQLVSTFGSFLVFRILDTDSDRPHNDAGHAIGVTLQVGTITALLAAYFTTKVIGSVRLD